MGHYDQAIVTFKKLDDRCRKGDGPTWWTPFGLAWIYEEIGEEEEARAYMAEALKLNPELSLDFIRIGYPFKYPAHLKRELDAHRKAGLPEKAPESIS